MTDSGYEGNRARFTGFAADYDRYRWRPPEALAGILLRFAVVERPELVVDLGCATGPSTRYWADRAERVVGVDPVEEMLATARAVTKASNVEYVRGYGHATGLPDACAEIVTCSQSFHWMEPRSTLAEVARILKPGGVFAAYNYRMLSRMGIEALERVAREAADRVDVLERARELKKETRFFDKDGHAAALRDSGRFAVVEELTLEKEDETTAERFVRGFETMGAVQTLRKLGVDDRSLGLDDMRAAAAAHLGDGAVPVHLTYRLCVGVLPRGGPLPTPDRALDP